MSYPLWYMKPIHVLNILMGGRELAYGASGIDGKLALNQVIGRLRAGWSTMISPDGPKGSVKKPKKGVLRMSQDAGVPVIPIRFTVGKIHVMNSWDKKR